MACPFLAWPHQPPGAAEDPPGWAAAYSAQAGSAARCGRPGSGRFEPSMDWSCRAVGPRPLRALRRVHRRRGFVVSRTWLFALRLRPGNGPRDVLVDRAFQAERLDAKLGDAPDGLAGKFELFGRGIVSVHGQAAVGWGSAERMRER